jgi:hypothetical protein
MLSRNRLRSFFMMLGVTIGIASLTALASVGEDGLLVGWDGGEVVA